MLKLIDGFDGDDQPRTPSEVKEGVNKMTLLPA